MEIAFLLVALAVIVLAGTTLAERVGFPAPLGLIVVGVVASYVPGVPTVHLSADVVLLGLLPPLLYSAAIQTSLVDFRNNKGVILSLSVGLVLFTALGVALFLRWALGLGCRLGRRRVSHDYRQAPARLPLRHQGRPVIRVAENYGRRPSEHDSAGP